MGIEVSTSDSITVISVDRTLDADVASRLRAAIRQCAAADDARTIVVDLGRAPEVTPIALAAIIDDVDSYRARVRFRGLSRHASRILAHLTARTTAPAT